MSALAPYILIAAFASLFFAPWPVPAGLSLIVALCIPVAPLAVGILYDALHMAPGIFPLATVGGALATLAAFLVRKRLLPGIIT